jgi:hypothetical protein
MFIRDIPLALSILLAEYNDIDTTDERRELLEAELTSLSLSFEDKLDSIATTIQAGWANQEVLQKEVDRLTSLAKSRESHTQRLERFVLVLLELAGLQRIDTPHYRISKRSSKAVCLDSIEGLVPEYLRIVPVAPTPDKRAIADALKSGIEVAGARLEERSHLIIR